MKKRRKSKKSDTIYKTVFLIIGVLVLAALIVSIVQITTLRIMIEGKAVDARYNLQIDEARDVYDGGDNSRVPGMCINGAGQNYYDKCTHLTTNPKLVESYAKGGGSAVCLTKSYECNCVESDICEVDIFGHEHCLAYCEF